MFQVSKPKVRHSTLGEQLSRYAERTLLQHLTHFNHSIQTFS